MVSDALTVLPAGLWMRPGPVTLLVRPAGWYLLTPAANADIRQAAWDALGEDPDGDTLLDVVASKAGLESADDLPAVLAAVIDGTTATLILKGQTPLRVYTAEGHEQLLPDEGDILIKKLDQVYRICFGDLPEEKAHGGLVMVEGAARVRGFTHMLVDPSTLLDDQAHALADAVKQHGGHVETEEDRKARLDVEKKRAADEARLKAQQRELDRSRESAAAASALRSSASTSRSATPAPTSSGPSVFDEMFTSSSSAEASGAVTSASTPNAADSAPAAPRRSRFTSSLFERRAQSTHAHASPSSSSEAATAGAPSEAARESSTPHGPTPAPKDLAEETLVPDDEQRDARVEEQVPSTPSSQPANTYDDLFGATVSRSVADAAVQSSAISDESSEISHREAPQPEQTSEGAIAQDRSASPATMGADSEADGVQERAEVPPAFLNVTSNAGDAGLDKVPGPAASAQHMRGRHRAQENETGPGQRRAADFIDWVPGAGHEPAQEKSQAIAESEPYTAAPTPPASAAAPAATEHELPDDDTIITPVSSPTATRQGLPDDATRQGGTASSTVPTVSAQLCVSGHANSPERLLCRQCGSPLDGTTTVIPRPPLGVVEISTGEHFPLDRGAVIGRRPRVSRVSGHAVPQLITVPSPQQDISRSHVELHLQGWHVVARDLDTTNGTFLLRGQEEPRRLRPFADVVLHDGDVLDLGDGIMVRWWENG